MCTANIQSASRQRKTPPRRGPGRGVQAGARCKEVESAPRMIAPLPLFYRYTDGAAFSFTLAKAAPKSPTSAGDGSKRAKGLGRGYFKDTLSRLPGPCGDVECAVAEREVEREDAESLSSLP